MSRPYNEDVTETQSCGFARTLLFAGLYKDDPQIRSTVLRSISSIVDEWTLYYLRHTRERPHKHYHANSSIGGSSTNPFGGFRPLHHDNNRYSPRNSFARSLKRESSSKLGLEFDDVFDDDLDADSDPRISSGARSPISTPLTPTYESGFPDDVDEKSLNGFIPPTFTISYMHTVLPAVENVLSLDDRLRLEELKDEVLTVHEMKKHLDNYYLALLRLSVDCPHREVRKGSRLILQRAVNNGIQIPEPVNAGPSRLVPVQETIGLNPMFSRMRTNSITESISETQANSDDDDDIPISPITDEGITSTMSITIPGRSSHAFTGRSRSRGRGISNSMSYRGNRRYNQSFGYNPGSNSDRGTPLSPPTTNDPFSLPPRERRMRKHSSSQGSSQGSVSAKLASPEVHAFHRAAWLTDGRITNMNRILGFYPSFAKGNLETVQGLISRPGSALSRTWRLYIGILAAAEHKCQYYVSLLSRYFLDCGGHKAWLLGLDYAPKKLQRLAKLNTLLAHQPWRLVHEDVQELIKGSNPAVDDPSDNWSTSEVVLAMCILSYYHAQSGFALACGLVPEVDLPGGTIGSIKISGFSIGPYLQVPSKINQKENNVEKESSASDLKRLELLPRTPSPAISLLTRKRQQLSMTGDNDVDSLGSAGRSPDKWLKTPNGSVPASADASPVTQTFRNIRSLKLQKRRKSFEDCVTAEDAPPVALATSLSAPGSYIPMSSISQYPLGAGREFFLSPSSSTSSLVEASARSLNEQVPVNVFADDNNRFLQAPSKTGIAGVSDSGFHEEFNLNSEEYSFLPMEDFDWERHACEVIGEYVEGLEDVLDNHFHLVRKINDEMFDDEQPQPISGRNSRVGSILGGQLPEFSVFEPDSSGQMHHGESFYSSNSQLISPSETFHSVGDGFPAAMRNINGGASGDASGAQGQVDIKPLKEAVWFYSLRLLGIQKDDYTYSDVKVYLRKGARVFLRRICEQPELVSIKDWKGVGMGLKSEEVVLMALLATQARFMGELLYGIKAVCEYRESRY